MTAHNGTHTFSKQTMNTIIKSERYLFPMKTCKLLELFYCIIPMRRVLEKCVDVHARLSEPPGCSRIALKQEEKSLISSLNVSV